MFIEENELHDIKGLLKGKKKPDAILLGLKKYFAEQFPVKYMHISVTGLWMGDYDYDFLFGIMQRCKGSFGQLNITFPG